MLIKVRKLWMGHASIRDYEVRKCIEAGEDLTIEFDGQRRTFGYETLNGFLNDEHMTTVRSKFDGKKYNLVDFPWV
jgi:hypothetical protein